MRLWGLSLPHAFLQFMKNGVHVGQRGPSDRSSHRALNRKTTVRKIKVIDLVKIVVF